MRRLTFSAVSVLSCLILSCSHRVALTDGASGDGRPRSDSGSSADAELRFCSGEQAVYLDGQQAVLAWARAEALQFSPPDSTLAICIYMRLQLPSGAQRELWALTGGGIGSYHASKCPRLDIAEIGLRDCASTDSRIGEPLDTVRNFYDNPGLFVSGWCEYNHPTHRMTVCLKTKALHPEQHPYLREVEVYLRDISVEWK